MKTRFLLVVAQLVLLINCIPPTPAGYIAAAPQQKGSVNLAAQAGGGFPVFGGGAIHVDPFVTSKLSIPVSVAAGLGTNRLEGFVKWFLNSRVGVRYRLGKIFTLGGGVSGGYGELWEVNHGPGSIDDYSTGSLHLDFEFSIGKRWNQFGLSFNTKVVWDSFNLAVVHFPVEFHVAWFPKGGRVGLTAWILGAFTVPGTGGGNGGLGLIVTDL